MLPSVLSGISLFLMSCVGFLPLLCERRYLGFCRVCHLLAHMFLAACIIDCHFDLHCAAVFFHGHRIIFHALHAHLGLFTCRRHYGLLCIHRLFLLRADFTKQRFQLICIQSQFLLKRPQSVVHCSEEFL